MLCDSEIITILGNYEIIKQVGRGTFSKVYEAKSIENGERFALKVLQKEKVEHDSMILFETELDTLMRINRHENVLGLVDAFETDEQLVIVTEYCDGGDLFSLIRQRGALSEFESKYIMKGLLNGLLHVHGKHLICHRDLKLENILLTKEGRVVIGDFGLSKVYKSLLLTRCGSEEYAAPEVILGKPYEAEKVDVWSFGIILFACLKGRLPFLRQREIKVNSSNPLSLYAQILSKNVVMEGVSEECKQVLRATLERDTAKRASFNELKRFSFFL
jgi:5'-AMP-activated protein kinase, catalytic alpha subunit